MKKNFEEIHIGKVIEKKFRESGITVASLARNMNCTRPTIYHIFNSESIDIKKLLQISNVLKHDFVKEIYFGIK